jgi:hypothetical protein
MIANHPDLLFAIIRNTIPNLALGRTGPVFVTRFPDVQEALSRPDVFNVTYAPMINPSVGPFMLGRDCTEINQRDKGIMRAFMRMEDLPSVRQKVCQLANDAVESQIYTSNQIDIVSTLSRLVPIKLTVEYFGFPGPDPASMFRWSRATQYDMFHNLDNDEKVHQDNVAAGHEMRAYLTTLLPQRRAQLQKGEPLDDIFSRLLKSEFASPIGFDDERLITNIMGTLVGGIETSSQAIVQILEQLFKRPKVLKEAIAVANSNDDQLMYRYCWRRCASIRSTRSSCGTPRPTTGSPRVRCAPPPSAPAAPYWFRAAPRCATEGSCRRRRASRSTGLIRSTCISATGCTPVSAIRSAASRCPRSSSASCRSPAFVRQARSTSKAARFRSAISSVTTRSPDVRELPSGSICDVPSTLPRGPTPLPYSAACSKGAMRGRIIWTRVPAPGSESRSSRPPSLLVTML